MKQYNTIIDVRNPDEFIRGHIKGSINIPLGDIQKRIDEVKKMKQPIILCCASGGRSNMAAAYCKSKGIDCENGGSWLDVNLKTGK